MLPVAGFFMLIGYTLMYAGIRDLGYAKQPWKLLTDAARQVGTQGQQVGAGVVGAVTGVAALPPGGIAGAAPVAPAQPTATAPAPVAPQYFAIPLPAAYA